MKFLYATVLLSCIAAAPAVAQQFLNGSFEPKGTITACKNDSAVHYNKNMGNNWALGPADTAVYLADNSCGLGAAPDGNHFAGLSWETMSGANYIVFKLDQPMESGKKYRFTFSFKKSATISPLTLLMGYTKDSMSKDSFVHAVMATPTTSWQVVTDSLTPNKNSQYIWIVASSGGTPGIIYVDNFKMLGVTPIHVDEVTAQAAITAYPNPFHNAFSISAGAQVALPYRVALYDVTGRIVMQQHDIYGRTTTLQSHALANGVYFLKLYDSDHKVYCTRVVAQ